MITEVNCRFDRRQMWCHAILNPLIDAVVFTACCVVTRLIVYIVHFSWEQEVMFILCVYLLCATKKKSSSLIRTKYFGGPVSVWLALTSLFTVKSVCQVHLRLGNRTEAWVPTHCEVSRPFSSCLFLKSPPACQPWLQLCHFIAHSLYRRHFRCFVFVVLVCVKQFVSVTFVLLRWISWRVQNVLSQSCHILMLI